MISSRKSSRKRKVPNDPDIDSPKPTLSRNNKHSENDRKTKSAPSIPQKRRTDEHPESKKENIPSLENRLDQVHGEFDIEFISEDNVRLSAHRYVLARSSGYIADLPEPAEGSEIKLDIDGTSLKVILDFMYTGDIDLQNETVKNILKAADLLKIVFLVRKCIDFIVENLSISNSLGICLFARKLGLEDLSMASFGYCLYHFAELCKQDEFLQLDKDFLTELISNNNLRVVSEEAVFESLMNWIEYDKPNRKKLTLELLSFVNFTLLKPVFIFQNRHFATESIEGYELISKWLQWHWSPEKRDELELKMNFGNQRKLIDKLILFTGALNTCLRQRVFLPDQATWSEEISLPALHKRNGYEYQTMLADSKLYLISNRSEIDCLNLNTNEWSRWKMDLQDIDRDGRALPALAVNGNRLYMIGGKRGRTWIDSVIFLDLDRGVRIPVKSLPTPLRKPKAVVLQGYVYVISLTDRLLLRYDCGSNEWLKRNFWGRNIKCKDASFAAVDGHIFSIGATGPQEPLVFQQYSPLADIWVTLNISPKIQINSKCVALNGKLVVFNPVESGTYVVEQYDPDTKNWKSLGQPIRIPPGQMVGLFDTKCVTN